MDDDLAYLLDRQAIDDLLIRYATAVDARRWSWLDTVFTPDAVLDYRSAGGIRGDFPEVRRWLSEVLPLFSVTQHLVVNRSVDVDATAGTARSRAIFHNPNQLTVGGEPWLFVVGGCYHDRLVRTPDGWRISVRVEETLWWDNPMPGLPPTPYPLPDDALI